MILFSKRNIECIHKKEMIIIQKQKYIISKQTQKNMINFLYQRPSIKHENNYQCHTGFILEEEIFKEFIANFDFSSYEKYEETYFMRIFITFIKRNINKK